MFKKMSKKLIPTTNLDCSIWLWHCKTVRTAVFRLFQIFVQNSEMIFRVRIWNTFQIIYNILFRIFIQILKKFSNKFFFKYSYLCWKLPFCKVYRSNVKHIFYEHLSIFTSNYNICTVFKMHSYIVVDSCT